jgi:mannosyltransferase OCH1-like enzyme
MDESLSAEKSTILTTKTLKIADVNKKIESYQIENFVSAPHQAFYMWGMKPGESNPCPREIINKNNKYIKGKIVGPKEIETLIKKYPDSELYDLWQQIPRWIVKADLGRLVYLYHYGGFYFDIDCEIKQNFLDDIKHDTILFTEFILDNTDRLGLREIKDKAHKLRVANYAMGSRVKKNKFYQKCIEECMRRLKIIFRERNKISDKDVLWLCGPDVITTIYHQKNSKDKMNIQLFPEKIVENKKLCFLDKKKHIII